MTNQEILTFWWVLDHFILGLKMSKEDGYRPEASQTFY